MYVSHQLSCLAANGQLLVVHPFGACCSGRLQAVSLEASIDSSDEQDCSILTIAYPATAV